MTMDVNGKKIVYYIESMQLHKIENKEVKVLAKLKFTKGTIEIVNSVSELELVEILNELER